MRMTIAETRRITNRTLSRTGSAIEYVIVWRHIGWSSSTAHFPDELRVGRITASAKQAVRAMHARKQVYVAPAGRYHFGDVLSILDGRDVCVELGLGPAGGYPDLLSLSRFLGPTDTADPSLDMDEDYGIGKWSGLPRGYAARKILAALGLTPAYRRRCELVHLRQRLDDLAQYGVHQWTKKFQPVICGGGAPEEVRECWIISTAKYIADAQWRFCDGGEVWTCQHHGIAGHSDWPTREAAQSVLDAERAEIEQAIHNPQS